MKGNNQEGMKKALAMLAIFTLAVFIGHIITTTAFNNKVHTVKGADDSKKTYMAFADRKDSTSTWVKRDFDLYGKKVDLNAKTIDGTFKNGYTKEISKWKMTIHIKDDCFINNAWCGTVEIHQFAGTRQEAVQKLDLRDYNLKKVKLKYLYDGDLLIPLHKGDYIVYYPSKKDDEFPISAGSELTIGTIFYYLDSVDLSDYEVDYYYHREMTEGIGFYALIALVIIWFGLLAVTIATKVAYKRAVNEMEIRTSGISYMSDIYDIVYIIDIETDELMPLTTDSISEKSRPDNMGARDQLLNLFAHDAAVPYLDLMQEFADVRTLNDRLGGHSIACDYYSKTHGWSRIRFFAMDREEGQPLKRVLFTIQNIEDEKQFATEHEKMILQTESEIRSKSIFFDIMSDRVRTAVESMLDDAGAISAESQNQKVTDHAGNIEHTGNVLLTLTDRLVDASDIYAGTMRLNNVAYSFSQMLDGVCKEAQPAATEKGLAFETNISSGIPDNLYGDPERISKIMLFLLNNSIRHTDQGSITLSIFEKRSEDQVHLLISIKDTGDGIREKDLKRLQAQWAEPDRNWNFTKEEPGLGLTMIHEMLGLLDSGLGLISEYGSGSEFYFEIEQTIIEPEPIGSPE